jgi:hypothetical protein
MADPDPTVRDAAAETLEKVNPKVHPHVFTILRGMNKLAAITALGRLGSDAAITVPLLLWCNRPEVAEGFYLGNTLPVIAKIAPKDKRFAAVVLAQLTAPLAAGGLARSNQVARRMWALEQLKIIDVEPAEKVKALILVLDDDKDATASETVPLITALQVFGKDAKPALPLLKKLKLSSDDAIRRAATEAVKKIEGE